MKWIKDNIPFMLWFMVGFVGTQIVIAYCEG